MVQQRYWPIGDAQFPKLPGEEGSLIGKGQVDCGGPALHCRVEPDEGVGWIQACEALHISPVGEGTSLARGGLVRAGPLWVMGVEVANEECGNSFI